MKLHRFLYFLLPVIILLAVAACAKIGSPYGGPKDETPPKVLKTRPPENSVYFEPGKNIIITFDEYIQLKDVFQELIISPPLDEMVNAQIRGKSLAVNFPDNEVFDTVTYTLDFGNSIIDNNEGNVLEGYRFVFSLKGYIDSLNVEGKIVSAFDHKPDKDRMFVMLYKNLSDSAPYLEKPSYICRTNVDGNFSLSNITSGRYRIFGLKDANANMKYDLPSEQIAFSDSIIELTAERFLDNIIILDDTLLLETNLPDDSLVTKLSVNDTLVSDTVDTRQKYYTLYTKLYFFTEETRNQYMKNYTRPMREQLFFSFNETLADTFEIFPLNYTPADPNWFLLDMSPGADTLKFWITDSSMLVMDTLQMEVCYPVYDSSGAIYQKVDTLQMMVAQERSVRARRDRSRQSDEEAGHVEKEIPKLALQNSIKNPGAFDLDKDILLISPTPLAKVYTDRIQLFRIRDTLEIPVNIEVSIDSNSLYTTRVSYRPEENTMYKMLVRDSTFFTIYGPANDTTIFRFKTQSEDYYGALTMNLKGVSEPVLLQLLDDKEKLLVEKQLFADETIRFGYLYPRKYVVKVIFDSNGNGKWDAGNYLKGIQPERVLYYPQEIDIRSNWEMDFTWNIKSDN